MADKVKCPECGSQKTWLKGLVPARGGPKQRYVCFDCGRTFYKSKAEPKPRAKAKKSGRKKAG